MKIRVIHGPNLNLLGERETEIYGTVTLESINEDMKAKASDLGLELDILQSNNEGDIVSSIGNASKEGVNGIVINPAAFTHTSVAILDALRATAIPVVEVHLSNISAREEYRKKSITAEGADGQIAGFGKSSYLLALDAIKEILEG